MVDVVKIKKAALKEAAAATNLAELERIRVKYLGRNGEVTAVLRTLKDLSVEKKREVGPLVQDAKREIGTAIMARANTINSDHSDMRVDLSAPGRRVTCGHLHPLTLVDKQAREIFAGMNFSVVEGPEIETEYYNFDALNVPPGHPAREMWDTFWLKTRTNADKVRTSADRNTDVSQDDRQRKSARLLRTHTSPMQVRYMEKHTPPFQLIVPGRVFRYEATDAGHEVNFYQLEGLMVGREITLTNFKFIVEEFFRKFFHSVDIEFRYRPSYFPFVEPGVEVDIKFQGRWFEIMGAGMVHARVFEYAHYNPQEWQGFAFGLGLDRLAMIKYKIPDIRLFYSGDLRLVRQF